MNYIRIITAAAAAALLLSCTEQRNGFKSLNDDEFQQLVSNPEVQILDVRTRDEFVKGHIPGAININIRDNGFDQTVREQLDANRPVAVYCRSGNRSKIASDILDGMGFEVYELDNGVVTWKGKVEY